MNEAPLQEVDARTLNSWLDNDKAVLIDIRKPDEYVREHIPGSPLLPLFSFRREDFRRDHEKIAVFHCSSGNRTSQAAAQILGAGSRKSVSPRRRSASMEEGGARSKHQSKSADIGILAQA